MNPITYALSRIREEIPSQLLSLAFNETKLNTFAVPVSVDSIIKERVLVKRVLLDCNLVGGSEVVIALSSAALILMANADLFVVKEYIPLYDLFYLLLSSRILSSSRKDLG